MKFGIITILVAGALALTWHAWAARTLDRRLLVSDPARLEQDAVLLRYAMPIGRAAYQARCVQCHGQRLEGDPQRGIPRLADHDWLYGTGRVGEIERVVLYGIRAGHSKSQNAASMPAFGTAVPYARYKIEPLRPTEVDDVAALVYSFQHPDEVDAATVRRGTGIFHGKGLCFDCHSDHATGDPAIGAPDLTDRIWLYGDGSRNSVREAIVRGLGGVCPQWIGKLDPVQIRAVAVFIHESALRK